CGKDDFKKTRDRDAYLNHKFLCKPSNIQNPIVAPDTKCLASQTLLLQNPATNQISTQTYVPVDDLIQLDDTLLSPIQNISSDNVSSNLPQNNIECTDEKWPELAGTLLYDYPKRNVITVEGNFGGKPVRKNYKLTNKELIFEECKSNFDPLRSHQNLTMMSLWQAVIPSSKNIKYRFNHHVENPNKYLEAPYMPQLIANAKEQITK
ncbi:17030_t:CDS:2, partial [Cetraspora pellucida]